MNLILHLQIVPLLTLLFWVKGDLTLLQVTPTNTQINANTTYTWEITFDTSTSRTQFQLIFPPNVTFSSTQTIVNDRTHNTQINPTFTSDYSLNLQLLSASTSTSFTFEVTNVKNPPFSYTATSSEIAFISDDSPSSQTTSITSITYTKGLIANCQVSFEGSTGDTSSVGYISFSVRNSINTGSLFVYFTYGDYNASGITMTDNGYPLCSYALAGSANFSSQVLAQNTDRITSDSELICKFTNVNSIQENQNITVKLNGIINPFTNQSYGTYTVLSSDGTYQIDQSSSCNNNPVTLKSYSALFTSTSTISSNYSNALIQSQSTIDTGINLGNNDTFTMEYTDVVVHNCDAIRLLRGSGSSVTLTQISSSNNIISYTATSSNAQNNILKIFLFGCSIQMAQSARSLPYTFTLFRNSLAYMQMTASLQAEPATITNASLTLQDNVILSSTQYAFIININYPLSVSPRIIIHFPSQLDISAFSQCQIILDQGIGSRSCPYNNATNDIQIDITSSSTIVAGSQITIKIDNIVNANTPYTFSDFNIHTYYSQTDTTTLVEEGISVLSQSYTYRNIYPIISNNTYKVAQPSTLTITYTTQVGLPSNSQFALTFSNIDMSSLSLTAFSLNSSSSNSNTSFTISAQLATITYTQNIPIKTLITMEFNFDVPSATGTYDILQMQVMDSASAVYEKSGILLISVTQPAQGTFTAFPLQGRTGKITNYTFTFTSTIQHNTSFYLQIEFPSDINAINGENVCDGDCVANVTDISASGVDILRMQITQIPTTITLTNIQNPRQISQSGTINLVTKTADLSSQIMQGTATIAINQSNIINAAYSSSQFYFRDNSGPVKLQINVTNLLQSGDYLELFINKTTYTLDSNISCFDFTCSLQQQTAQYLKIKATPSSSQLITKNMSVIIQGLLSSNTSTYNQQIVSSIVSYSRQGNIIDQGSFTYTISCGQTDVISLNCKTCINNNCLSCYSQDSYYLYTSDSNDGQCTLNCSSISNFFTYPLGQNCVQCVSPCKTCSGQLTCLSCIDGYFLYQNTSCLSVCNSSEGYYEVTISSVQQCNKCPQANCIYCQSTDPSYCLACSIGVNNDGKCDDECPANTYLFSNACFDCDSSCNNCTGPTNTDCSECNSEYVNVSGQCLKGCPAGSEQIGDTCGCSSQCSTCEGTISTCLSCYENSLPYLYKSSCYVECPSSTYFIGKTCYDCSSGCLSCTKTSCLQCANGTNLYQNNCYVDCNEIDVQFSSANSKCIKCQQNCDECDENYLCYLCQDNYTLINNQTCLLSCTLDDSCEPINPIPDTILPIPGSISAVMWIVIVVLLKITKFGPFYLYVPYALIAGVVIIKFGLELAIIVSISDITTTTARLLQIYSDTSFLQTAFIIMISAFGINYLMNIAYLVVFFSTIKKLIHRSQVDRISNYILLFVGTITTYRFSLLAYSKMFPNPKIFVSKPQEMKSVNVLCFMSIIFDGVSIAGICMILINGIPLTDIFMLSIDLLVIIVFMMFVGIWALAVPKPEQYYQSLKKYFIKQTYQTEEGIQPKLNMTNDQFKSTSQAKLNQKSISYIQDFDHQSSIKGDPFKQEQQIEQYKQRRERIQLGQSFNISNPEPILIMQNKKEKKSKNRNKIQNQYVCNDDIYNYNESENNKGEGKDNDDNTYHLYQVKKENQWVKKEDNLNNKGKTQPDIYSVHNFSSKEDQPKNTKKIRHHHDQGNSLSFQIESDFGENAKSKKRKPTSQRSEMAFKKKKPVTIEHKMRFKEEEGNNVDEIDLESIIQTKMIDRRKLSSDKYRNLDGQSEQNQEVSPSWFNNQNQRYDLQPQ